MSRAALLVRRMAPLVAVLVLTVAFRLPPLVNSNALNSDAAIVGLQARHVLQGEFSLRLWGAPYQAPLDAWFAAALYAIGGSSASLLLMVPLLGMLLMVALAYSIVSRHTGQMGACLAVLPLVFATQAVNSPMTYVLRQSLATWAIGAVWCFEVAPERPRPERLFALGGILVGLGLYLDTFFAVLMPPLLLFGALRAWPISARKRALSALAGALLGGLAVSVAIMRCGPARGSSVSFGALAANWALLWKECLPFALGIRTWLPGSVEWTAPGWVQVFQVAAACAFVAGVASGLMLDWRGRSHALGVLGVSAALTAIGGFLLTGAPFDMWSTRYLAPLLWLAPFALTPLIARLGTGRAAMILGPWALSALVSGWMSYGEFIDGAAIRRTDRGIAMAELDLGRRLRELGVHHGRAQYWQAYRLSLLWQEDPLVVPLEADLDRIPEARRAVDAAPRVAAIFHPSEPRASPADYEASLINQGTAFERHQLGEFTVFITSPSSDQSTRH